MSIRDRLRTVFIRELKPPAGADVATMEYQTYPAWDSVGHMRLVAAVESEFGVFFETMQILDFSSFAKGLDILKAHGVKDDK